MANSKNIVEDIKKELARVRPKERPKTTKEIIGSLVEDIHAQMKWGARLDDVYTIIRARLPEETKLTLTTFKRYWREARDLHGLSKMKNSGKKKIRDVKPTVPQDFSHMVDASVPKVRSIETSSDFREDPDDI